MESTINLHLRGAGSHRAPTSTIIPKETAAIREVYRMLVKMMGPEEQFQVPELRFWNISLVGTGWFFVNA